MQQKNIDLNAQLPKAMFIAQQAVRALLYEVAFTPKPGLVDRQDTGAHKDMDFFTFIDSSCTLFPYFNQITLMGMQYQGDMENMLPELRELGKRAEENMFHATNNVNTHKGIIFSLGIICAAYGWLTANNEKITCERLLDVAGKIAKPALDDFIHTSSQATNGEKIYGKHGLTGIRGEASSGFPNIAKGSYPLAKKLLEKGYTPNDVGVIVLIHLIANVQDSNIISRSTVETQRQMQKQMQALISKYSNEEIIAEIPKWNDIFIKMNISPGGCADLLAITFFLLFIL